MPTSSVGVISRIKPLGPEGTPVAARILADRVERHRAATARSGSTLLFSPERGVTLLEMMVVTALMALLAALTFPSVASGLDSLRLRSSSDSIVALLNTAADRADRRQQAVQIVISPKENSILARSADLGFTRHVTLRDGIRITAVMPGNAPGVNRDFLIYPGGTVPAIAIEIATPTGHRRTVSVDPVTGEARTDIPK